MTNVKAKIFIDGSEGTTGLRIHERFQNRDDIQLLTISSELRKDAAERARQAPARSITAHPHPPAPAFCRQAGAFLWVCCRNHQRKLRKLYLHTKRISCKYRLFVI